MGQKAAQHQGRALWLLMLVALAGIINTGGVISYGHTVSHMTGNLTTMGITAAKASKDALRLGMMLVSFILGSTVSGLAFPQHAARQWKRCGTVLTGCGALLLVSELLPVGVGVHVCALSFTMGAQNGLAVRYRGILSRTTHVTGHLTDCGAALGRLMLNKGSRLAELRLFLFHLSFILAFFMGVLLAAWLNPWLKQALGIDVIDLAALMYLVAGAATWMLGQRELAASWTPGKEA